MNASFMRILLTVLLLFGVASAADAQRLTGTDSGRPPAFTVDGPWMLDWSTKSDYPLLASIEIRLYDGESGDYLGMVAELNGTGRGLKFFENPGTYQFVIVGRAVDWELLVEEISEQQAAAVKRQAASEGTLLDTARATSSLVPESSFESWRPEGNDTLLLFDDGRLTWRVTFSPPCPGLESATALSFVMRSTDSAVGQYDSILLDDGHRCYFGSVVPGLMQ